MIQIFFDLDGTLIDCSKRNYFVYNNVVEKLRGIPLSFASYWELKRDRIDTSNILIKSDLAQRFHQRYSSEFIKLIESPKALKLDKCFSYTITILKELRRHNFDLYLVR